MARNFVLDSGETPPSAGGLDLDSTDEDFHDAVTELNALNVRIEATKVQQLRWRNRFVAERKKLMDTLKTALARFDQDQVQLNKPIPPTLLQKKEEEPEEEAPPPAQPPAQQQQAPLQLGIGPVGLLQHSKLEKTTSSHGHAPLRATRSIGHVNYTPAHVATSGRVSALPATEEEAGLMKPSDQQAFVSERNSTLPQDEAIMSEGLYTGTSTPASKLFVNLRHAGDDGQSTSRSHLNTSPVNFDEGGFSPKAATGYQATDISRPTLMVSRTHSQHQGGELRRPPGKLIHRATAMDLDELRRVAERTFQRQTQLEKMMSKEH